MRLIGVAAALAVSLTVAPFAAEGQQAKTYRVGVLNQGSPQAGGTAGTLTTALRDLGYSEGRNICH